ncbi:MAG: hypothetical protein ACWA41_06675 [Putridiphycobacter sp.]
MKHNYYMLAAFIFWGLSFTGEMLLFQPFSTIGLICAPIVLLVGIIFWVINFNRTHQRLPNLFIPFNRFNDQRAKNLSDGLKYIGYQTLKGLIIFGFIMMVIFNIGLVMNNLSPDSEKIKSYCQEHTEIKKEIGEINYIGHFVRRKTQVNDNGGTSKLKLTLVTEKGNYKALAILQKIQQNWVVVEVNIY